MIPAHIPGSDERAVLNVALATTGAETGFYDEHGQPAPWPNDIDEWGPTTGEPITTEPGQQPF